MFGDRADRPSAAPISSATEASSELKMESVAGSVAANPRPLRQHLLDRRHDVRSKIGFGCESERLRPRSRPVRVSERDARVAVVLCARLSRPLPKYLLRHLQPDDYVPGDQVTHERD